MTANPPVNSIDYFDEYMVLFRPKRHKLFHGGRGGGKSWHIALALLAIGRERKLLILCVREIQNSIKDSVHRLLVKLIGICELTDYVVTEKMIRNRYTGTEFIFKGLFRNENTIKSLEDADYCWVEEAQALSVESIKYLIPTIRKSGSELWYSMNRFSEHDPIWDKIKTIPDKDKIVKKINMMDLPDDMQSDELIAEMQADKIADFDLYMHTWEGEPVGQDPNAVMNRTEVSKAMERKIEVADYDEVQNGADIARFGDDLITMFKRKGFKSLPYKIYSKLKTTETEDRLKDFIGVDNKEDLTKIDLGNMGSGIYDHLKDEGYNMYGIDFGGRKKVKRPDKYYDVASEMWFEFAENLDKMELPNDTKLKDELTKRMYVYKKVSIKEGKSKHTVKDYTVKMIESKREYKKRETDSPDRADGVIMCYYDPKKRRGFIGMSNVGLQ